MRKAKVKCNIDRLKLKCSGGDWLFDEILAGSSAYYFDGAKVQPISLEYFKDDSDEARCITADVYMEGYDYPIVNLRIERKHYTSCKVYNRVFYSDNLMHMVIPLLDELQLRVEAVERVELAVDTNVSILARLRAMIKNVGEYDMIVNGAKVAYDEACLTLISCLSRKRTMLKNATICHSNSSGFDIKIYDKRAEILQSGKDYIQAYNDMKGSVMQRIEIGLSGFHLNRVWEDGYELLHYMLFEPHRLKMVEEYCNRILRFNSKSASQRKKSDTISILDLIY